MAQHNDPPIQSEKVREILRESNRYPTKEMSIWSGDGSFITAMMKTALDEYDEPPTKATQYYDADTHTLIIDLPDPANRDVTIENFKSL